MKEKEEVRIAYRFNVESKIGSCRNSDGRYAYVETETDCYGLYTDIQSMEMNLREYEVFLDIERKYKPQAHTSSDSGPFYTIPDEEIGTRSSEEYHSINNKFVSELNEALSESLNVIFVAAKNNDALPYPFLMSIGSEVFDKFEKTREDVIAEISKEVKDLNEQISMLQRRKEWLENESNKRLKYASAVTTCIKELVEQGRISINDKIPTLDMYPLQIAEKNHSIELYELLLSKGAKGYWGEHPLQFHSWYGFFKRFINDSDLETNELGLIISALYELSDNELEALLVDEEPNLCYKGLTIDDGLVFLFRDFFVENYCNLNDSDDYMCNLFDVLVADKRYKAIEIIKQLFQHNPPSNNYVFPPLIAIDLDEKLFKVCVLQKNLEALRKLEIRIKDTYLEDSKFCEKHCNEENLGKEMMEYIKEHTVKNPYHN